MTYTPAEVKILAQMASMANDSHTDATDMGFQCREIQEPPMGEPRNHTDEIANARAEIERDAKDQETNNVKD